MKRKILSFLIILTLVVTAFPVTGIDFTGFAANASEETRSFLSGDFEYIIINENEVEIKTYFGDDTEVIIPSEIKDMPVTSIGEYSFTGKDIWTESKFVEHPNAANNKKIQKLVIPSSVKTICDEAFSFIDCLSEVVLNEGLISIGEFAFADCPLLTEIALPESFSDFNITSFENTGIEELTFGSNLTHLKLVDFEGSVLKRIICNAENVIIDDINLTENKTCLEEIVFNGKFDTGLKCLKNLGKINKIVSKGGAEYNSIIYIAHFGLLPNFNADGSVVFAKENVELPEFYESSGFRYYLNDKSEAVIVRYIGTESDITVPEILDGYKVVALGDFSFSASYYNENDEHKMTLIRSISLPETITKIGIGAFAENYNLISVNIPSGITEIPQECFYNCLELKNIILPDSVEKIGSGSFNFCWNLESISMPSKIKEIKSYTFYHCSDLVSIDLTCVEKIGDSAFYMCSSLTDVVVSEKLTEIGIYAFFHCTKLKTIDLSNVTYLGASSFSGCYDLNNIVLNDNIEHLEPSVFNHCSSLDSIELPYKLVSIGSSCFYLTAFTKISFGENLKAIESQAFARCSNLKTINFPDSLEKIGNGAFRQCIAETITIPENVKILGKNAFARNGHLTTLYFNAKNCVVENYGEIVDEEDIENSSPFYATNITNIYFGANVAAVNSTTSLYGTFEGNESLESVTIPDSVNEIGTAAFKNCTNLETAVIPESVTEIADDAFDGCDNLIIYCTERSYACTYALSQGIKVSTFIIETIPNQTYTGSRIEPTVSVSTSSGKLNENIDFSVTYSNNINVGEAKVKVTGMGDYCNYASVASFTIVTRSIKSADISNISTQNYTGKAITPSPIITYNRKVLKEGTDYRLHYFNNKNIGEATIQIEGIGNFSGSDSVTFSIEKLSASESFLNGLLDFFNSFMARLSALFS